MKGKTFTHIENNRNMHEIYINQNTEWVTPVLWDNNVHIVYLVRNVFIIVLLLCMYIASIGIMLSIYLFANYLLVSGSPFKN